MPTDIESQLHDLGEWFRSEMTHVAADEIFHRPERISAVEGGTLVGLADRPTTSRRRVRWLTAVAAASVLVLMGGLILVAERGNPDGPVATDATPEPTIATSEPSTPATSDVLSEQVTFDSVDAAIIGRDPAGPTWVEIDRGSLDGVRVGMPVVNEAGLVGKVTMVTDTSSIVLLVTSPDFQAAAKLVVPDDPGDVVAGIVTGQGFGQPLRFRSLDRLPVGVITRGDFVLTAGRTDSLAPANIPIGVVTEVTQEPGTGGADGISLDVEHDRNINDESDVQVILYQPSDQSP